MPKDPMRRHYNVTFVVLAVGVVAYAVMQSSVMPVLPTLQHDLHTTQNTVTWVLTVSLLSGLDIYADLRADR